MSKKVILVCYEASCTALANLVKLVLYTQQHCTLSVPLLAQAHALLQAQMPTFKELPAKLIRAEAF